nr:MAG TPA: hypothetical protein [Caudoviricetes sp.]
MRRQKNIHRHCHNRDVAGHIIPATSLQMTVPDHPFISRHRSSEPHRQKLRKTLCFTLY